MPVRPKSAGITIYTFDSGSNGILTMIRKVSVLSLFMDGSLELISMLAPDPEAA